MEEHTYAGAIYGLHTGDHQYRYIGMTRRTAECRLREHIKSSKYGSALPVHRWMRKHGTSSIKISIIETFNPEDIRLINGREIYHIAVARELYPDNLNLTDGGEYGKFGYKATAETRTKMSLAKRGRKLSTEHRNNISAGGSGKHVASEKMISNAYTMGKNNKGRTHTEETKSKMSATHIGNQNGVKGRHVRWHLNKNLKKPDCIFCADKTTQ